MDMEDDRVNDNFTGSTTQSQEILGISIEPGQLGLGMGLNISTKINSETVGYIFFDCMAPTDKRLRLFGTPSNY